MPQIMYFSEKIIITGYNWFKALVWLKEYSYKVLQIVVQEQFYLSYRDT